LAIRAHSSCTNCVDYARNMHKTRTKRKEWRHHVAVTLPVACQAVDQGGGSDLAPVVPGRPSAGLAAKEQDQESACHQGGPHGRYGEEKVVARHGEQRVRRACRGYPVTRTWFRAGFPSLIQIKPLRHFWRAPAGWAKQNGGWSSHRSGCILRSCRRGTFSVRRATRATVESR
jgi:hypothetical protein